jgi:hypothetical protein
MPRSLHNNNTTKVRDLDVIVPAHPPRLMPTEFQLLVYILHLLRVDMTDWMNLLYWYMFIINAMRSCSERTILHCVESYLYYIILVNKKNNSEEWNEGENK